MTRGYRLKTRTTSQTLDMVRTCIDLAPYTDPALESFSLFYREQQKVWDGVAGMCLALVAGLFVGDGNGRERTEIEIALDAADPVFDRQDAHRFGFRGQTYRGWYLKNVMLLRRLELLLD